MNMRVQLFGINRSVPAVVDPVAEECVDAIDAEFERSVGELKREVARQKTGLSFSAVDCACECSNGVVTHLQGKITKMRGEITASQARIGILREDIAGEEEIISGKETAIAEHERVISEFIALSDRLTGVDQHAGVSAETAEQTAAEEPAEQ